MRRANNSGVAWYWTSWQNRNSLIPSLVSLRPRLRQRLTRSLLEMNEADDKPGTPLAGVMVKLACVGALDAGKRLIGWYEAPVAIRHLVLLVQPMERKMPKRLARGTANNLCRRPIDNLV